MTTAIQNNDPHAQQTLLSNPQTPEQLKPLLVAGGLEAQVQAQIDQQYQQIESTLKGGNPEALTALQSNPQMPQGLKDQLAVAFASGAEHPTNR